MEVAFELLMGMEMEMRCWTKNGWAWRGLISWELKKMRTMRNEKFVNKLHVS